MRADPDSSKILEFNQILRILGRGRCKLCTKVLQTCEFGHDLEQHRNTASLADLERGPKNLGQAF